MTVTILLFLLPIYMYVCICIHRENFEEKSLFYVNMINFYLHMYRNPYLLGMSPVSRRCNGNTHMLNKVIDENSLKY